MSLGETASLLTHVSPQLPEPIPSLDAENRVAANTGVADTVNSAVSGRDDDGTRVWMEMRTAVGEPAASLVLRAGELPTLDVARWVLRVPC